MPRKWRERRGAQQKKVERKGVFDTVWDGRALRFRHGQTAAAVRHEEEVPKVEALQSRLCRAAAAFWR